MQGRAAGIKVDEYHGLIKGSKRDQIGMGILFESWGSRRRATYIGVGQYHRFSKGFKMDLVGEGISAVGAILLHGG